MVKVENVRSINLEKVVMVNSEPPVVPIGNAGLKFIFSKVIKLNFADFTNYNTNTYDI